MTPAEREATQRLYNFAVVERYDKTFRKRFEVASKIWASDKIFFQTIREQIGLDEHGLESIG